MALEIERRFLVCSDAWRAGAQASLLRQGFVSVDPRHLVRVRIAGDQAWLALKADISAVVRQEFEYPIPLADAESMLESFCTLTVDKLRYRVEYAGWLWEIDEYDGANRGLVVAEIELPGAETGFDRPAWLGEEITHDARYSYAWLSQHPYSSWPCRPHDRYRQG